MIDERERTLLERMVHDDSTWPGESFCVKQKPKPGEKEDSLYYKAFGCIFKRGTPIEIHLRDFDPAKDFIKSTTYDSVDAMIADGWIVD